MLTNAEDTTLQLYKLPTDWLSGLFLDLTKRFHFLTETETLTTNS